MLAFRFMLLRVVILGVILVFLGRLAFLQLIRGSQLRHESKENHQRWVRMPAPRGVILDRTGTHEFATSTSAYSVWLVSGEVPRKGWDQLRNRLVTTGIYPDAETAKVALADARRFPSHLPIRLRSQLTIGMLTRIEEGITFLPGIYVREEPVRYYPNGSLAAHLIGYFREIGPDELAVRRAQGYRLGDRIGKAGLERAFENELKGTEGGDEVEVDAHGRVVRTLRHQLPQPGNALRLTLDADIQRTADEALVGHRGAVVALDPNTGDILAMASAPTYDVNRMSGRISPAMLQWLHGPQTPELNRATSCLYPPGSVFKIVTASAALEAGTVKPTYYCDGAYHGIRCWRHTGHGTLNLTEAIAQSCNVSFMRMAEGVGIARLSRMARLFGLGQPVGVLPRMTVPRTPGEHDSTSRAPEGQSTALSTGILPEARGVVPDPAWSRKVHRHPWELGDTLQVGIGQSYLTITPLQSARIIAAVANGGKLVHPRLVQRIGEREQPLVPPTPLGLKSETLRRLTVGLRAVVGEGTARTLDPSLHIAGKTGTAQNPPHQDHAWFVGFAPAERPRIAVAVLIEYGGHGGATAAPIAEKIIRVALQGLPARVPPAPAP